MGGGADLRATGGVRPVDIEGRMKDELLRKRGMTDAERAWRSQWLKDQVLSHNEPRHVPEIEKELLNPIRRFYQKPLNVVFKALEPVLGVQKAAICRRLVPIWFFMACGIYGAHYCLKYNNSDWTRKSGWVVQKSLGRSLPGDPDYPRTSGKTETSDYADKGFKARTILRD